MCVGGLCVMMQGKLQQRAVPSTKCQAEQMDAEKSPADTPPAHQMRGVDPV
jgi:hypothetical protein